MRDGQERSRRALSERPAPAGRPPSIVHRVPRPAEAARAHLIEDHLLALQLPVCYPTVASVNAYLLGREDGWLLIDCGSSLPPGWDGLLAALARAQVPPQAIDTLIVSHSHADHRGLAAEVVRRTGCRLAMGPGPHTQIDVFRDASLPLAERMRRGRGEGVPEQLLTAIVDELPASDTGYPHCEPEIVLAPGQTLRTRCGELEVIALPGHSADQIGLWNREKRWLISADVALPGEASYLEYGTQADPHAGQLASLDRAIALDPELLLSGHGRPRPSPRAFLEECRAAVLARLDMLARALDATPRSTWEIAGVLRDDDGSLDQWQRSLTGARSVLEHLQERGEASGALHDDGIWRWTALRTWRCPPARRAPRASGR